MGMQRSFMPWLAAFGLILALLISAHLKASEGDLSTKVYGDRMATIAVAPIFVSDPAEHLGEAFFADYMDLVRADLQARLSDLTDDPVVIEYAEPFELDFWSHNISERVYVGMEGSKTQRRAYRVLDFKIHWASSLMTVNLNGLNHMAVVDAIMATSRKVEAGAFGAVLRTAYADQVYDSRFKRVGGDLPVSLTLMESPISE